MELPEENLPQFEPKTTENEQKEFVEAKHNEIPPESDSVTVEEDVAPAEHASGASNDQSEALSLENEDQTHTATKVVFDIPGEDDVKEVETDLTGKEPGKNMLDEQTEIGIHISRSELIFRDIGSYTIRCTSSSGAGISRNQ